MLKQLSEHYGEAVMPVSQYCDAFRKYASALRENKGRSDLVEAFNTVLRSIPKSNLLARLIYGGEQLRSRKRPIHKGRWSGCIMSASSDCPKGLRSDRLD